MTTVATEPKTAETDAIERRVRHLFRALTRAGLVHPLEHLILRYRSGVLG
ncbi:hypothetical protein HLB44_33030 [Aquincola sp. S2]|uniref:Uncharacterized protein n=1 Tax=Pseudaquabacterium terrae TaxID=2732868 RepID=A0ABX2ET30_9BURK|nr:hypothetical protein [Aquabacterium terrae]NRF71821.1 hypothetical protein [Aquabacterium terrae]